MKDTVKIEKRAVRMIAHRGLSGIETENTLSAFVAAGTRTYFGIETDVHTTADGKFIVIHDATTERVAEEAINVEESTLEQCRRVRLRNRTELGRISLFPADRGDLILPTLSEYIGVCKKYDKRAVLEIKGAFSKQTLAAMIAEIEALDYLENVIFISFYADSLINLRALLPEQKMQFLTGKPLSEEIFALLKDYHLDLDADYSVLTKEAVDRVHSMGLSVNCWTCDTPEVAAPLIEMGVDYTTTNILE